MNSLNFDPNEAIAGLFFSLFLGMFIGFLFSFLRDLAFDVSIKKYKHF